MEVNCSLAGCCSIQVDIKWIDCYSDHCQREETVTLENPRLTIEIDDTTGAIVSLTNRATGWRIQDRSTLGRAFSMNVPLPDRLLNPVSGIPSTTRVRKERDQVVATIVWDGVRSPYCDDLPITLRASVVLDQIGATFSTTVENRSSFTVESVAYPCIGDLGIPTSTASLVRMAPNYSAMQRQSLYPRFPNEHGYWGTDYPLQTVSSPISPFVLIQGDNEGVYLGVHDRTADELVQYWFELKPGYGRVERLPEGGRIGAQEANLECYLQHFPFVQPGQSRDLSPIHVASYEGTWHNGADVYKEWRDSWMMPPSTPDWLMDLHSWQQLQMSSWGDSLRIRYADLVDYASECARNGVGAIQLVGWTLCGQDGRIPEHVTDPRLGTRQELREAIQAIQDMGIRVVLYQKYNSADVSTDWYRSKLHRYSSKDIHGNTQGHGGWRYHTPAHLAGINVRPYAYMCMNSTEWQNVALSQIERSLDLRSAGILLDENNNHGYNGVYCFDPNHGHRVPSSAFAGDAEFERRVVDLLRSSHADLVFAGEGNYDLQQRYYNLSYHRAGAGHIALARYLDPSYPMMSWVRGFDDRESINLCLLYRYIISYEPMHFKGRLERFPLTLEYGTRVDRLRARYRAHLWDGVFRDTVGVDVECNGRRLRTAYGPDDDTVYSVFASSDGTRAVVLVNHCETSAVDAHVRGADGYELRSPVVVTPEEPEPRLLAPPYHIPARSAVVLIETKT